jgi:hypothetical protein
MIVRTKTQSVYYPVSGRRIDAICGSGRILYCRGLVVVKTIRSKMEGSVSACRRNGVTA